MDKSKIGLQLDLTYLKGLCNEKTSGVSIQKCQHHLEMFPIHFKNFSGSVKDLLNLRIAKFDKKLGGILLGYQNIKLININGIVHNDSNVLHVDLEGDFFVFKPTIGREMQGIVKRKGKDFVGVLVYNTFNVSIPQQQNEDIWLGHEAQIGDEILFQLQHIDTSLHLPYIRGKLLSIITKSNVLEDKQVKRSNENRILEPDKEYAHVQMTQEEAEPKRNKKRSSELDHHREDQVFDDTVKKSKKRKFSVCSPGSERRLLNDSSKGNILLEGNNEYAHMQMTQEDIENVEEPKAKRKKKLSLEENHGLEHDVLNDTVKKSKKRKLSVSSPGGERELSLNNSSHKKSKYAETPT